MNIQFETTNKCNLACVECPHRLMERKQEFMSKEVFDVLLNDYIIPMKPGTVIVHKDGEPLLHPDIRHILRQISVVSNAKIDIYTNGILLKKDFIEFLYTLDNLIWVLISFHFYDHSGKMYDYSKVSQELNTIFEMPIENVEFVMATHTTDFADINDLREWQSFWKAKAGPDKILKDVHVNTAINPWAGRIKQKSMSTYRFCPYMDGEHFFVGVTGNVIACCMDLEEEIIFGNILTDSKNQIMKKRDEFYNYMRRNIIKDEVCFKCLK